MLFFNAPKNSTAHYSPKDWINAGLSAERKVTVVRYLPIYEVANRYSPGLGAIVIKGAFYLHAGSADLNEIGFSSAGCIEIIGNFDDFKKTISDLSGTNEPNPNNAYNH